MTLITRFTLLFSLMCSAYANQLSAAEKLVNAAHKNKGNCNLILGVSDWAPYQIIRKNTPPSGIQIELIQAIAKQAKCTLTYKTISFPEGLAELRIGTIDLLMNATPTEERKLYAKFSIPYRQEILLVYSTEKYLDKCQTMSLQELLNDGFKLGVQKGIVYSDELTLLQKTPSIKSNIFYVEYNINHLELIRESQLDGIIDDPIVMSYRSTVNTTKNQLQACPIVVSSPSYVSLMFSKKTVSDETLERFNRAIEKVKTTNEYRKDWIW
jgi:polar amino acid transport system substrate-binding protein